MYTPLLAYFVFFYLSFKFCFIEARITGYVIYCPCMGRFGNQIEQFLGNFGFAKRLNRTLVVSPWIFYDNNHINGSYLTKFSDIYQTDLLAKFHDVIELDEFMKVYSSNIWPPKKRTAFCYVERNSNSADGGCAAKDGRPFWNFWNYFNIDFIQSKYYAPLSTLHSSHEWNSRFPTAKYPVLAFISSPGLFPGVAEDLKLQKFLSLTEKIVQQADTYISHNLVRPYLAIHLRNNIDFRNACDQVFGGLPLVQQLFSSAQCTGTNNENGRLTYDMCFPSEQIVLKHVEEAARRIGAKSIFIATDFNPMLAQLWQLQISLHTTFPKDDPLLDLALLMKSDLVILNCVSSFSAIVKRDRDNKNLSSEYFAFSSNQNLKHVDL